ncbi:MAG: MtaA/CmuA family methyltransferase [Anaerolineae bacterium]|nr:MtaA/CmuA family methyltransferase [Anaerolineae bacterium]
MTTERMSPKRRFLAGILGGRIDRTPVGSPTSVATVAQMETLGAYFPQVHRDGAAMARLAAGAYEILGYDAIMPVFSVIQEAAALGCEIDWGGIDSMPNALTAPWQVPEDVCLPADWISQPSIVAVLDALAILRREYRHVALIGKVMGPWTLAYHMHGLQPFLIKTLTEPDTVKRFLERLKAITLAFGKAQIEAGADLLCLADHATGDLVRGSMYHEFLEPIHRELIAELGCPIVLHICGNTLDRIGYIADAGFDAFHFESKVDAAEAVRAAGGRMSLVGNVNNPTVLLTGTPEMALEQARYAMASGVQVLGPECAVPLVTPIDNLRAIRAAAVEA